MNTDAATEFVTRVHSANLRSRVDAVTAEVVLALMAEGVRPLLFKGPLLSTMLYGEDSHRVYADTDLLVGPSSYATAEDCLTRLGFDPTLTDSDVPGAQVAGHQWRRSVDNAIVDLHWTIAGIGAPPAALWAALAESTTTIRLAGVDVDAPSTAATALIVALHAAHHGARARTPREDLARALDQLDRATWAMAARLAERLDARHAFAAGLLLAGAEGRRLAAALELPTRPSTEYALRAGHPPPGALTLNELARVDGIRPKLSILVRKAIPTRRFMRVWFPRSGLGGRWLALGYAWRPLWLLLSVPRALLAWRSARRLG